MIGVVAGACVAPAATRSISFASGELQITATPVARDSFRITAAPSGSGAPAGNSIRCDDSTLTTDSNGTIRIQRGAKTVWSGRVRQLKNYGRADVRSIEIEWSATPGEGIYGLGERFNRLNQSGRQCEMWIRDDPGQSGGDSSYDCSPVLFSTAGYALFAADNPEGNFDLNSSGDGVHHYRRSGDSATFYVATGDTLKDLVLQRARVQGPFGNIPKWAWGPWMSRNSYENQGEAEDAIRGMIERQIPVSVIVQEAWKGKSEPGDFNHFSKEKWPKLERYFTLCAAHGIKTILWQVPVIYPVSPEFAVGRDGGFFVKDLHGAPRAREHWLEGFYNIDFTNPQAVEFWKELLRPVVRMGIAGFKVDDGEDIEATDLFSDGRRGWQVHNEYAAIYAQAVASLFKEEKVDAILWTRSGSLGNERAPAMWAGDQYAKWDQLRSLLPAGLSASISGTPFWGHDIGGYIGTPSPELYIRWAQFGAFSPLMQFHGQTPREPWVFGDDATRQFRALANLRMNLRPTLVALGNEAAKTGMPIMRPMILEFPDDARFVDEDSQYMLGPDLLIAPVLEEGAKGRTVKFPKGTWRNLLGGETFQGPGEADVTIPLDGVPAFVRKGAALQVELDKDAALGTWHAGSPVRTIKF